MVLPLLEEFVPSFSEIVDPAFLKGPHAIIFNKFDDIFTEGSVSLFPPLMVEDRQKSEDQNRPDRHMHPSLSDHTVQNDKQILQFHYISEALFD